MRGIGMARRNGAGITGFLAAGLVLGTATASFAGFPRTSVRGCSADAVVVGAMCLDRYEASVWRVPNPTTTNAALVRSIRLGRVTEAELIASGAEQLGLKSDDYAPCLDNGQICSDDIYAVSLPSVIPSANITWFQAGEACANAGKRLPTNQEWQVGANGRPDPGPDNGTTDCNTASDGTASLTGTRAACVSARGAFDMVGNVAEWVADWVPAPDFCLGWGSFSDDEMCIGGASANANSPGALVRGGAFAALGGRRAGAYAVHPFPPFHAVGFIGFRCAR